MFKSSPQLVAVVVIAFSVLAVAFIVSSLASITRLGFESESGQGSSVIRSSSDEASGGSFIEFANATGYDAQLQRILNSTTRNRDYDNRPFMQTPSTQLPVPELLGDRDRYRSINDLGNSAGNFRIACEFSHFAYDDPIALPDQPNQAHLHMFFGNTHANAYSTYDSLYNSGSSTCNGYELNRTSYWVPALIDQQGNARTPIDATIYYKAYGPAIGNTIVYPQGMRFISGNPGATSPQPGTSGFREIFFRCYLPGTGGNDSRNSKHVEIPNCPSTHFLEMNVKFQTCWNGQDPANYQDNAAFSNVWPTSGSCPGSHPINLPQMEYRIYFQHEGNSAGWILSSDVSSADGRTTRTPGWTIHGDWYGGWHQDINRAWIDNCLNVAGADCGAGLLADPDQPSFVSNPDSLKYRIEYTGPNKIPGRDILNQLCDSGKTYTNPASVAYCYKGQ